MKAILIVIIAFLAAVYVYTFIKWKKRRTDYVNTVEDFRKKFSKKEADFDEKSVFPDILMKTDKATINDEQIDYIEHEEFIKEITDKPQKPEKHYTLLK